MSRFNSLHRAVLTDIVEVLFNEQLIKELEETPQLGKHTYVKHLMEDIASVSVMRLDQFSMNKLWELMIMVFKWQLTIIKPNELFLLTERHLQGVLKILHGQPIAVNVKTLYHKLSIMSKSISEERTVFLRNSLLSWLNDFHTKVSLLLRLGLQRSDGSFVIVTNPDEKISKILERPGDNIYSYENMDNSMTDLKTANADLSEIYFLVNDLLGNSKERHCEVNKIKHCFLQQDAKIDEELKNCPSSQCEFAVQSTSTNSRLCEINDIEFETERENTLHDDLLMILESNELN